MADNADGSVEGAYKVVEVDGFPGDGLVLYVVPGFEPVAVASLPEGLEDGLHLVREAHLRHATWRACMDLGGSVVVAIGKTEGGDGLLRPRDVPSVRKAAEALFLGGLPEVVEGIEESFSCRLAADAVQAVAKVLAEVEPLARSPLTLHKAAYMMQAASPGPTTLMRRMESARLGLQAPAEQAYPAKPANDVDDLSFVVGSTVVHVLAGYGGNERVRPVEITVEIAMVKANCL